MNFKHILFKKRCFLIVFSLIIGCFYAQAQGHIEGYGAGEYPVDSADAVNYCRDAGLAQYYSLRKKHPLSSTQLLAKVQSFYKKPLNNAQSGYLTVRFIVTCKGETCCFKTYEIDENYQTRSFDSTITNQLKTFVKELGGWKSGEHEGGLYNYYYYFSFKIQNGEIQNITP